MKKFIAALAAGFVFAGGLAVAATEPWSTFINSVAADVVTITDALKFGASAGDATARFATGLEIAKYIATKLTGDCTGSNSISIICSKTNGVVFATSATVDTTNASNISSGTLPAARIGNASIVYGKIANGATTGLLGVNNGAAPSEISLGTNLSFAGSVLNATGGAGSVTVVGGGNLTNNAPVIGGGLQTVQTVSAMIDGQLLTGATGAAPVPKTMSGDCTFAASGAITCPKVSGVVFAASATNDTTNAANITSGALAVARIGASAASHAVPVDVGGTSTYKVIPDCQDSAGNHLNFTQGTDAFSCGNTSSGSSGAANINVSDGTTTLAGIASTVYGNGFVVSGSASTANINLTFVDRTITSSATVLASDMANGINVADSATSLTLPATTSTIFPKGSSLTVLVSGNNTKTLINNTGLTLTGLATTALPPGFGGTFVVNNDTTHLDFFPGMQPPTPVALGGLFSSSATATQVVIGVNAAGQLLYATAQPARGGTGLTSLTANMIYRGQGTSPMATTNITDDAVNVQIATSVVITGGACLAGAPDGVCLSYNSGNGHINVGASDNLKFDIGGVKIAEIASNGAIFAGTATAQGPGTINAQNLYVNGTAVSAGSGCNPGGSVGQVLTSNGASGCTPQSTMTLSGGIFTNTNSETVGISGGVQVFTVASGVAVLGANTTQAGSLQIFGGTSGNSTITVAAAAGSNRHFQLPTVETNTGDLFIGQGSGVGEWEAMSGDATIGQTGAISVGKVGGDANVAFLDVNQSFLKAQAASPATLLPSSSTTVDASRSNSFTMTLAAAATLANPTNMKAGQFIMFYITQDATGSHTLGYGTSYKFAGGTTPSVTATGGAEDALSCGSDDGTKIICQILANVK